jgi:hypothetical protein
MSKRPIRGESSSTAHKRQAVTPEDEDPLPSASASASLAQHAASLSIPKIPLELIADLILPFVADRATWNSVYSASKELHAAGKKMTPPWPNKAFNVHVRCLAISPSRSQLAFGTMNNRGQYVIHVWDPWGKETILGGHTGHVHCMEYSLDGEHLASGSADGSIRIWHTESFHTNSSNPDRTGPTRTPKQADIILLDSRSVYKALSFSRTDSNLLASGNWNGEIKMWNIKEQACIHSFDYGGAGQIRSLFFAGGADRACFALTYAMSIIRLWRAEGSSDLASETIGETDHDGMTANRATISPSGSFLATSLFSRIGNGSTVALYELETMTKTQSVVMPGFIATCFAVSPDSKQLVIGDCKGRIRLLQNRRFQHSKRPRSYATILDCRIRSYLPIPCRWFREWQTCASDYFIDGYARQSI